MCIQIASFPDSPYKFLMTFELTYNTIESFLAREFEAQHNNVRLESLGMRLASGLTHLSRELHVEAVRGVRALVVDHRYGVKVEQKHALVFAVTTTPWGPGGGRGG